ncbi:MAG TPA: methyltransferase [Polyangiaceae bacterium]|nr:methyltransferase [Polyangiaceae bacterium]
MTTETQLPPQFVLYQIGTGHYFSRALAVAAKLGIADHLAGGPRSAEELAAKTETHAPALRRVLRLLVTVGVFAENQDGTFALTPISECLRSDVAQSARASVLLFSGARTQDAWKELEYCVRTGEPAYRKHGIADPFVEMAKDPAEAANFDAAMAGFTRMAAAAVAREYDFSRFETLMDVGGGNGALLIGILKAHERLRGIVFDQPHVAERAEKEIAGHGLADRCRAVGGDFFDDVPSGADAYLLKHVIHDWDDERAVAILRNCGRAMGSKGTLLILEGVYPPRIDASPECRGAAANDVNMLVNTGGRQRSEAEFHALYQAAGFRLTRIVPTPVRICVIEGSPV